MNRDILSMAQMSRIVTFFFFVRNGPNTYGSLIGFQRRQRTDHVIISYAMILKKE